MAVHRNKSNVKFIFCLMLAMNEGTGTTNNNPSGGGLVLSSQEFATTATTNNDVPSSVVDDDNEYHHHNNTDGDDFTSETIILPPTTPVRRSSSSSSKTNTTTTTPSRKRKRSIIVDKFEAILKTMPSISSVFEVRGKGLNSKLHLKLSPNTFRFHKSTLMELLNTTHLSDTLLAKFLQESSSLKDARMLAEEIADIATSSSSSIIKTDQQELSERILEIASIVQYSEDKSLSCWEVKDKALLGEGHLFGLAKERENVRLLFQSLVFNPLTPPNSSELASDLATFTLLDGVSGVDEEDDDDVVVAAAAAVSSVEKELQPQHHHQTPQPPSKKKKESRNSKLTNFFTIIPTTTATPPQVAEERWCRCCSNTQNAIPSTECCFCSLYFRPFFSKPGVTTDVPSVFRKTKTKLLQFHTTFHPPYYGCFGGGGERKEINPRKPFKRYPSLVPDYSHDSDDEWGEDAEIEDAESITASDDEDDEEEEEEEEEDFADGDGGYEEGGSDGVDDVKRRKWIISDSDDEDEKAEAEARKHENRHGTPSAKRKITKISIKKIKSRKEKVPIVTGPYGVGCFSGIFYNRIVGWPGSSRMDSLDPFEGSWSLPVMVQEAPQVKGSDPKIQFTDEMIPSLAVLANGSPKSVSKLYNSFCLFNGSVSKRAFEMRLNQICYREKGGSDGNVWMIRQEYSHLLPVVN